VKLDQQVDLPDHYRVRVSIEPLAEQRNRLRSGLESWQEVCRGYPIHAGGRRFTRDELHERGGQPLPQENIKLEKDCGVQKIPFFNNLLPNASKYHFHPQNSAEEPFTVKRNLSASSAPPPWNDSGSCRAFFPQVLSSVWPTVIGTSPTPIGGPPDAFSNSGYSSTTRSFPG